MRVLHSWRGGMVALASGRPTSAERNRPRRPLAGPLDKLEVTGFGPYEGVLGHDASLPG
jgi:hypothetical protein